MIDPLASASALGTIGELNTAMAENQSWLAALEEKGRRSESNDAPSLDDQPFFGIDGAGFFVLSDRGTYLYARSGRFHIATDGRLLDAAGREVLGFASGAASGAAPQSLRVSLSDLAAGRFSRYEVDDYGVLRGIVRRVDAYGAASKESGVELGRLCIAIFPAPERLSPHDGETALAARSAGKPQYLPAGAAHVGELRHQPLQPPFDALRDSLRRLWSLSGRAEIEVAVAASKDTLTRIALNLVK